MFGAFPLGDPLRAFAFHITAKLGDSIFQFCYPHSKFSRYLRYIGLYRVNCRGLYRCFRGDSARICTRVSPTVQNFDRDANSDLAVVTRPPRPSLPFDRLPRTLALDPKAISEIVVGQPDNIIHVICPPVRPSTCPGLRVIDTRDGTGGHPWYCPGAWIGRIDERLS